MIIINNPFEVTSSTENLGVLRTACNSVECCPNSEDSGWTSNPESDMNS